MVLKHAMSDSTRTRDPDLSALTTDFDIVGELAGKPAQYLIARRRSAPGKRSGDSDRVLIEVVRSPEGDESHALDHLASDTKLLSGLRHRRLVSIVDGRWLGDDTFAVVREYVDDPSVADLLARGDSFTNTRIAAILREVHGVLQWARAQDVVHRRVTPDRLFLEPTSDRVRVTFGAGALQRVRTVDPTTEDVVTVVRLAVAMLTGGVEPNEEEGQSFAELRPDLPERLFEETDRLLTGAATDAELTLYLALIGMADPVAEGETERDRIRAEILEEQRVEREKLARERADLDRIIAEERRQLAEEGEELRAAFAQEKARLERVFSAAQRLLAAERAEMQRIIAEERAELVAKRTALLRELDTRVAEIEHAAAADRAKVEAVRAKIQKDGETELERIRSTALEDLDDSGIRIYMGKYATPRFIAPKLAPFPELAFRRDEHLKEGTPIEEPTMPAEPWSVLKVVQKLREPRRRPIPWRRWAERGGIAAAILITAAAAVIIESRTPDRVDTLGAAAPPARPIRTVPPITTPSVTSSSAGGLGGTPATTDSLAVTDSLATATGLPAVPSTLSPAESDAVRARRDSVRRANTAAGGLLRSDSAARRPTTSRARRTTRTDDQDLMLLSDSLANRRDTEPPEPPTLPQPTGTP
jgi:serine/threonine protein kinase